jgi:hypothetical protein
MPLITDPIGPRRFEQIRQVIGTIIKDEVDNQASLQPAVQALQNVRVTDEKGLPPDFSELPLVNVTYFNTDFDNVTTQLGEADGTSIYFIDVFHKAASSATQDGDALALQNCQRLAGVIQFIFADPRYKRLLFGFQPPFMKRLEIRSITMAEKDKDQQDLENTAQCRLQLIVEAVEDVTLQSASIIDGIDTTVKIAETDIGFEYIS